MKTLVVPEMEELRGGEAKRSVREIRIEDLLGREEIHINLDEIGNLLEGKTVLVTGAAGSIGSEICRQLAHFPIKKLVCFDSAETPMHNLRLELEEKYRGLNFVPVIGDVRSPDRVDYSKELSYKFLKIIQHPVASIIPIILGLIPRRAA